MDLKSTSSSEPHLFICFFNQTWAFNIFDHLLRRRTRTTTVIGWRLSITKRQGEVHRLPEASVCERGRRSRRPSILAHRSWSWPPLPSTSEKSVRYADNVRIWWTVAIGDWRGKLRDFTFQPLQLEAWEVYFALRAAYFSSLSAHIFENWLEYKDKRFSAARKSDICWSTPNENNGGIDSYSKKLRGET